MGYDYPENILVQESAGHLLERELGWEVAFSYNTEQLGIDGTFGRTSHREILLTRYFRETLQRLNPWLTSAQLDEAQKKMGSHLSTASLMQINEEKYALIRDGIPVTVQRPGGRTEVKKAAVIDFQRPDNNRFLAIKELKIHGNLYRRRTDIVGFLNGIPLLFVELKKHGRRSGCLYQQLHGLSGHYPSPVPLQRFSYTLQWPGSQGRHPGQQI